MLKRDQHLHSLFAVKMEFRDPHNPYNGNIVLQLWFETMKISLNSFIVAFNRKYVQSVRACGLHSKALDIFLFLSWLNNPTPHEMSENKDRII